MKYHVALLVVAAVGLAGRAQAAPITVQYLGNFIESQVGDQGLPYFLDDDPNNLRLKFFVPDFNSLLSLSSINVSVDVFDDGDADNERGEMVFVLNEIGLDNIDLNSFNGLGGTTAISPATIAGSLTGANLANALLEIQGDGIFFIRINRRAAGPAPASDFWVQDGSVVINGELAPAAIPEPASLLLVAAGVAGLIAARRTARARRQR